MGEEPSIHGDGTTVSALLLDALGALGFTDGPAVLGLVEDVALAVAHLRDVQQAPGLEDRGRVLRKRIDPRKWADGRPPPPPAGWVPGTVVRVVDGELALQPPEGQPPSPGSPADPEVGRAVEALLHFEGASADPSLADAQRRIWRNNARLRAAALARLAAETGMSAQEYYATHVEPARAAEVR